MTEFYLQNISKEFQLSYSNEYLSIEYSPISTEHRHIGKIWPDYNFKLVETGLLKIQADTNDLESKLGRTVSLLMSLAFGRDITFDRTISNGLESIKEMVKPSNSGLEIIPPAYFRDLLIDSLENFMKLNEHEQEVFRIGIHYLNHTRTGYIEDRILRATQAWELTSDYFFDKVEIDSELVELKNDLLNTYKQWLKKSSFKDENSTLGSKISGIFQNQKLLVKMGKLASDHELNTRHLNLDLRKLKNLRDQVAHTGRINITGTEAIGTLNNSIKGLQLIWLKRIGYLGNVTSSKDGWKTLVPIEEYFQI